VLLAAVADWYKTDAMAGRAERRLATILFTDMVGSTELAAKIGDARWRELLRRHHAILRRELKRFGGREIDIAGDGVFAIFDVPAQAVRCACAIVEATQDLGVDIRAGLHVGEVEVSGREVRGIAVHTGSRLCGIAGPTDVLVTATLTELVGGARLEFEERGVHRFKGVPGEWRVFNVTKVAGDPRPTPIDAGAAEERLAAIQPPPFARRYGGWIVGAAAVVVAAVAATVILTASGNEELPPAGPPRHSMVEINPSTGDVLTVLPDVVVGSDRAPSRIAVGEGGVWLLTGSTLVHVDELSKKVESSIGLDSFLTGSLAIGYRTVWITGTGGFDRINPATNEKLKSIPVPFPQMGGVPTFSDIAVGAGAVWGADYASGNIARVNPQTSVVKAFRPGGATDGVAVGDGAVWVIDNLGSTLSRIDPGTDKVTDQTSLNGNLSQVVAGGDAIWILDARTGNVTPVDTDTLRPLDPVRVGPEPSDIAFGMGAVWVTDFTGAIYRIDPVTREVSHLDEGFPVAAIGVDERGASLWLAVAARPNFPG
jgi:class 3 adenylate cyclase/streptogramin lyase